MIAGIGIDLIETARIRATLDKFGDRFCQRVFTKKEVDYCNSMKFPDRHLAARFAAKEAVSKCFGTGIGSELGWKDIEVVHDGNGRPLVQLHGNGSELARRMNIREVHVSLSHTESYGCAVAMAEK
jgi:holo-[acyl-carrier protein] synthase